MSPESLALLEAPEPQLEENLEVWVDRLRYSGLPKPEVEEVTAELYQRLLQVKAPNLQEDLIYALEAAYEAHDALATDVAPLKAFLAQQPTPLVTRILLLVLMAGQQEHMDIFKQALASDNASIRRQAQEVIAKHHVAV